MPEAAISQTRSTGREAGETLAGSIMAQLGGSPDALIVFASPDQDHQALLLAIESGCSPGAMVGCTSAGEFTSDGSGTGMTCAIGLRGEDMSFAASVGTGLREDRHGAAQQIVDGFQGARLATFPYRSALVLTDALAGFADDLVDRLTLLTGGIYRFFGGGAGDDARFQQTFIFHDTRVLADAAVALEILSHKPVGVGVAHGWTPGGDPMRVTEAAGMRLGSLDAVPAAEVFDAHAEATGQPFAHDDPVPFFLHNVLGVRGSDGYRLRVPLAVEDDGSVACAADVPAGSTACIMATTPADAATAAASATRAALDQIGGAEPAVAFLFDCVATRLRLGQGFEEELEAVQRELGDIPFGGFNTYGQIAQSEGQLNGFHNCTAVVCVIPR